MRILITGSNSGFGKLASLTLARRGHNVVATMRSVDKATPLLDEAAAEGLDIEVRQLDVCEPDSVAAALADPPDLDVVVNNAGFEVQGALELINDELMHRQLDTNVLGPFRIVVGDDANLIIGAKTSMSFEDFEHTMRSTIDWHD